MDSYQIEIMLHVSQILIPVLLVIAIAGILQPESPDAADRIPDSLKECPGSPNCVSSEPADPKHRVDPFRLKGDPAKSWPAIIRVVRSMPRTEVVSATDQYIRTECKSRIFRFVDDLELLLKPAAGIVSVRSASRSGYYDFGVNRKRIEYLRQALRAENLIEP